MSELDEARAAAIFTIAIRRKRAAALLKNLFDGGGVTVVQTRELDAVVHDKDIALITPEDIRFLAGGDEKGDA